MLGKPAMSINRRGETSYELFKEKGLCAGAISWIPTNGPEGAIHDHTYDNLGFLNPGNPFFKVSAPYNTCVRIRWILAWARLRDPEEYGKFRAYAPQYRSDSSMAIMDISRPWRRSYIL